MHSAVNARGAAAGHSCTLAIKNSSQTVVFLQKEVHLEAFQCSAQAVQLWKDGWFREPDPDEVSAFSHFHNPRDASVKEPVMISGKDTDEVRL